MCFVSNIGTGWQQTFPQTYPQTSQIFPQVSREEFDRLKKDVEELRELLKAAKRYDEATGQPDCEMDEKVDLIKRVAEAVGVDISDVFGDTAQ